MAANLVPAAQYLRMSTEHQQYSLENQSTAIQKYADAHSFEVVRTYSDAAKSGVALKRRAASVWTALITFVAGASYQVWDAAYLNRGVRKKSTLKQRLPG